VALKEQAEALKAQTFQEFEWIVVDNAREQNHELLNEIMHNGVYLPKHKRNLREERERCLKQCKA